MSYLQRYLAGDHQAVWRDLAGLDHATCAPDIVADAEAVAVATMERVAIDIDRLVDRLTNRGYAFGLYPDGETVPGFRAPRVKPHAGLMPDALALHEAVGPLPLSLRIFWEVVGEVSLVGLAPDGGMPDYADPLWVEGPAIGLADLADAEFSDDEGFFCPIAPDLLHKDNVSGGSSYAVSLPDGGFDALVRDEWHGIDFIPYLRTAILDWGGFPGLSEENPQHGWRRNQVAAPWVKDLTRDLLAF